MEFTRSVETAIAIDPLVVNAGQALADYNDVTQEQIDLSS